MAIAHLRSPAGGIAGKWAGAIFGETCTAVNSRTVSIPRAGMGMRRAQVVADFVGKHVDSPGIVGIILVAVENTGIAHPVVAVGYAQGIEPGYP